MANTSTLIPFRESPDYKGGQVLALNAALIACTTIVVGLRLYVRGFMSKTLGVDDAIATMALLCVVTQSAFDIRSVSFGSGAHIWYVPPELIPKFFSNLVNNTLLYFFGTGLMRLSIVAFLPRLAKNLNSPIFLKAVYAVGLLIIGQTLGCFFYRLTECRPISDAWLVPTTPGLNCVSAQQEQANIIAHQALGIIIDFALFALPIWVIHQKMIFSSKKVQVILVFSVGSFVVVCGIVRMVLLNTLIFLEDPTFLMTKIGAWTDLEGHVGLWCASFPALQPLIRSVAFKLGLRSNLFSYGRSNRDKKSGHARNPSRSKAWNASSNRKNGYARNGSGIDTETDTGSERGIVAGQDKSGLEMYDIDAESGQIRKQRDFDVKVEERSVGTKEVDGRGVPNKSWVDV